MKQPWWKFGANAASEDAIEEDEVIVPQADASGADSVAASAPPAKPAEVHPVLKAALAAGVTTEADFADLFSTAKTARVELQTSCVKEAIRCFGQDAGPAKAKALEGQSYSDASGIRDIWRSTADAAFQITEAGGSRHTAPVAIAEDAGNGVAPASATPAIDVKGVYASRQKQVVSARGSE